MTAARDDSMIRVVEFVGMMGSGKTALAELVAGRLHRDGIATYNYPAVDDWILRSGEIRAAGGLAARGVLESIPNLGVGLKALRLAATIRPHKSEFIGHARRLAGWHGQTRYLKRLPRRHLALQDEGAVHLIMPLVLSGLEYCPKRLDELTRRLAAEEHKLFVFVRVDPDSALHRLRQRSGLSAGDTSTIWRYNHADAEQERQIMLEMETLFERIARSIKDVAAQRTLVVTNDSDPLSVADDVSSFIRTHIHDRSPVEPEALQA